jgi:Ca-activated chloride channel homolog
MSFYYFNNIYFVLPLVLVFAYLGYLQFQRAWLFYNTPLARNLNYEYSRWTLYFKYGALLLAFILLGIAMLRPQWGVREVATEQSGRDLIFALDVSQSMKALDMDSGGQVERLVFAKKMINDFVNNNPGNRYGLIIFAGEAFVSTPLTSDLEVFLTFLDSVDYSSVGKQGTDLEMALVSSLSRFFNEETENGQGIVLISDGGDEIDGDFEAITKKAKELGVRIITIGVGSKKEVPIPAGTDLFGRISYKTYQGKTVMTKLNEAPLKRIAEQSGGRYYYAETVRDLDRVASDIASLKESIFVKTEKGGQEDRFYFFLWPSFILFLIYLFIIPKNYKYLKIIKKYYLQIKNKQLIFLIVLVPALSACSPRDTIFKYYNHEGVKAFDRSYLTEARENYTKAADINSDLKPIAYNNDALTYYYEQQYDRARDVFEKTELSECENSASPYCAELFYNLGNTYYRLGEEALNKEDRSAWWQKAIEVYERDLEISPDDTPAQENIDFILQKMKEAESSSEESGESGGKDGQEEGGSGEEGDGSGEDGGSEGTGSETEGAEGEAGSEQAGDSGEAGEGADQGEAGLSYDENASLERYLQQMEEGQKNMQKYFNQDGQPKNSQFDPFQGFFGGSLFDGLMGQPEFNNQPNTNEKDW